MADQAITLREHLEELRKRLLISVVAVVVAAIAAFVFRTQLLNFLLEPAQGFGNSLTGKPVFTGVTEMLGVVMKTSIMAGVVFALPVVLYQLVMFVAPGLNRREKTYLFIFLPATVVAFASGVLFGYYVLFPPAMRFLFTFGTEVAVPMIRIGNYMDVVTSLLFWMGLIFELPLVFFFLARLGVVTSKRLFRYWRYSVVVAFLLCAAITPTGDTINQSLVAASIVVLYGVGILLAKVGERLRRGPEPTPDA